MKGNDAIAYILYNIGCVHPYIISRILAMAELNYYNKKQKWLTDLKYNGIESAFYIENFDNIVSQNECFKKREGDPNKKILGCIEYICEEPDIGEDAVFLDEAIDSAYDLDENQLNINVINDKNYKKLLKK